MQSIEDNIEPNEVNNNDHLVQMAEQLLNQTNTNMESDGFNQTNSHSVEAKNEVLFEKEISKIKYDEFLSLVLSKNINNKFKELRKIAFLSESIISEEDSIQYTTYSFWHMLSSFKEILIRYNYNYSSTYNNPNTVDSSMKYKNKYKHDFYNNLCELEEFKFGFFSLECYEKLSIFLLKEIIGIVGGQEILQKIGISKIFGLLNTKHYIDILFEASLHSNLPVFLIINNSLKMSNYVDIDSSKSVLSAACRNSDIRILKFVIDNFEKFNSELLNHKKSVAIIIRCCFSQHIPIKYCFKRLKIVNSVINFSYYFDELIYSFYDYNISKQSSSICDLKSVEIIFKYYYSENSMLSHTTLDKLYLFGSDSKFFGNQSQSKFNLIYQLFKGSIINKINFVLTIFTKNLKLIDFSDVDPNYKKILPEIKSIRIYPFLDNILCNLKKFLRSRIDNNPEFHTKLTKFYCSSNYPAICYILNKCDKSAINDSLNEIMFSEGFSFKAKLVLKYRSILLFLLPWINYLYPKLLLSDFKKIGLQPSFYDVNGELTKIWKINRFLFELKVFRRKLCKLISLKKKIRDIKMINNMIDNSNDTMHHKKYLDKIFNDNPVKSLDSINIQFDSKNNSSLCFNHLPPRNILPFELEVLRNEFKDNKFLIRKKADGFLTKELPFNVFPSEFSILENIPIKAEFIEELDLFLIFDFDMNKIDFDKCYAYNDTLVEKNAKNSKFNSIDIYNFLRRIHPSTSKLLCNTNPISDLNELIRLQSIEENNFNEFLKMPYESFRVYPKASWLVNMGNPEFVKCLEDYIFYEKENFLTYDCSIPYDGIILTPVNTNRDLKLKPLSMQTIDLSWTDSFEDREKICWNERIEKTSIEKMKTLYSDLPKGSIVRLKPILDNSDRTMFTLDDVRHDKNLANPNKVVCQIINILENRNLNIMKRKEITKELSSKYYYEYCLENKPIYSDDWKNLVSRQSVICKTLIDKMNPKSNSVWLDLGCGCSTLKMIEMYNIAGYIGIDFCVDALIKNIKNLDKISLKKNYTNSFLNRSNMEFDSSKIIMKSSKNKIDNYKIRHILMDLNKDWFSETYWDNLTTQNSLIRDGINYVVCTFALPHFISNNFWTNLNKLVEPGCKFMFNIVNNDTGEWRNGENYMFVKDGYVYYKFMNNLVDHKERFISHDEIMGYLEKFNWKCLHHEIGAGNKHSLTSSYTYYIVEKY